MARFDFALDVQRFSKELEALGRRGPIAMARAINRGNTSGKVAMVRAVAKDTGIQQKNIERDLRIEKATRTTPVASIEIRGRRIPLIAFQARGPEPSRGRGRGVSYRLPGGRGRVDVGFIATMPSGHRGVFKRPGALGRRVQGPRQAAQRLPIVELFGPSLPHVFAKYLPVFEVAAQEAFVKNLEHEISFQRGQGEGVAA